ncbi:hypothetical protein F1880_006857 [Penicillium rolfsii]|nr:hypothetical protein F1880_006857 [Penicillium rolfsii]
MATGTVKHSAPTEVPGGSPTSRSHIMHSNDIHEKEKHLIQSICRSPQRSGNPFLINERRDEKQLCLSSRSLHVNDFVLMKTLGTGTFARVWLTRLKDETDKSKVYALKILRKADVIKLKQVEHVRNERKTLAAVIGHPFITTLIASFSDEQNLYMLVWFGRAPSWSSLSPISAGC